MVQFWTLGVQRGTADVAIAVTSVALRLLCEFVEELVESGAQVLHELSQFFLGGATIHRVAKRLLRCAQVALGVGEATVLDAQCHLPQKIRDIDECGVCPGAQ